MLGPVFAETPSNYSPKGTDLFNYGKWLKEEDLRESTEGWKVDVLLPEHPIMQGLDLTTIPPVLGYNIVKPRAGCDVIANWSGTRDPMLVTGCFGSGRVLVYTSDPAPHWGCNSVYWSQYPRFWQNSARWLVSREA